MKDEFKYYVYDTNFLSDITSERKNLICDAHILSNDTNTFIKRLPINISKIDMSKFLLSDSFLDNFFSFVEYCYFIRIKNYAKKNAIKVDLESYENYRISREINYFLLKEAIQKLTITSPESFILFLYNLQFFNFQFQCYSLILNNEHITINYAEMTYLEFQTPGTYLSFILDEWNFWNNNLTLNKNNLNIKLILTQLKHHPRYKEVVNKLIKSRYILGFRIFYVHIYQLFF